MMKKKVQNKTLSKQAALETLKFYTEFLTNNEITPKFHENITATIEAILNYEVLDSESK